MKVIIKPQRILGADDAADYVDGESNLRRLLAAKWLHPLKGKARGMDYDIKDLDAAVDRVRVEGWPA